MTATAAPLLPLPTPPRDPWDEYWFQFETAMEAARKSPKTIATYTEGSRQFVAWLRDRGLSTDPVKVDRKTIRTWLAELSAKGAAPATIRVRYAALRRFFNWLVNEEELEVSPMAGMETPKAVETVTEFISDEEVRALLKACAGKEFLERRDTAIFTLLYDTGLRRGGLVSMTVENTDLRERVALITLKGGRQHLVPFGAASAVALQRYLRVRAKHWASGRPEFWLTQRGALRGDGVHHLLTRRAALAGIDRGLHPHMFRHSFADRWKSQGGSEEGLMRVGGWTDLQMVRRYGSAASERRAREEHARMSPADRLLGGA